MENQTRFDLNAAIENWCSELAAQPNLASDDRRELETHLRDAVAGFQQRGLNDEESFWLARRRVGLPQQLGEEFVKADPAKVWRERIFWVAVAFLTVEFWISITNSFRGMFPNNFRGDVNSMLFYQVIFYGPILWVVISLALGRMTKIRSWEKYLIRSRLKLLVIFAGIIALRCAIVFLQIHRSAAFFRIPERHTIIQPLYELALIDLIRACVLPLLIVWLMPAQNRKTPKRT
jgi:uncharacterized membrane protein